MLPRRFRSSVAAGPCGPGRLATGSLVTLAALLPGDEFAAGRLAELLAKLPIKQGRGKEAEQLRRFALNPDGSIRRVQQPHQDHFFYRPGCDRARADILEDPASSAASSRDRPDAADPCPATLGPRDAPPHAGQVVRRVLAMPVQRSLRRPPRVATWEITR
jgi:hypothetical protein